MVAIVLMPIPLAWSEDQTPQYGVLGPSRQTNMLVAGGPQALEAAQPPMTGIFSACRYFWLAASAMVASPTIATTWSDETSVRAAAAFLPGSPASSIAVRLTL